MKMEEYALTLTGTVGIVVPGQTSDAPYAAFMTQTCEIENLSQFAHVALNIDMEVPVEVAEHFMEITRAGLIDSIHFMTRAAQPTKEKK